MSPPRPKRPRTVFRDIHGIVLLDKPAGISSNQALQRVRHLLRARKGGHTGALDPLATGLLPICLGEATKLAGHLLGACKAYETVARLGRTTDTADADGTVLVERPVPTIEAAAVEAALVALRGRIMQRPPVYSALKQGGEPLYAKARRGEAIEVPEREVEVHGLRVLEKGPDWLRLHVECGSGTYVRSLVTDLGESLGCGAHVEQLRRLWVAPFDAPCMVTIEQLEALDEPGREAWVLPLESGLAGWRRVVLDPGQARHLGQGRPVPLPAEPPGEVAVFDQEGGALGLGSIDASATLRPRRLFSWASVQDANGRGDEGPPTGGPL
ncbi:tRNA pseudouridine(55) synthase TruB [Alkalisalibacterium limincola]|uniref:tRNA pseudouridine synthase B n=1 Tax=Alkalisalibacterium limincola TaxID=2699169 RepID=A0A5C8KUU8_9GAMM|nr:tRNA pseudouridine(55) synthase TruB [Alkalisalibacterium limincola]TXK65734.1 tRNA pseudouridine(55) synthase TruB [Alkalisalibacterium limincola]